ncbi:unnamed protein product [Zymoseptoria tritici ST99CH_1A5]|uniref:RING-type domain-containing protein n=2 Tax=Zymoseptoria tritici TaxID=1047171 RepID=A0A2H1GC30_ZYMTR|nr:unnamed protein product [Zymoseptoria tritici ST99CH_1E4]SMR52037.1 unnamed protein product [Zymoseptoria tritici ST99CH_3D1]SMY23792.1 unnamed protein product [Zymoseptoria tritici ST99CH_1A5]
MSRTQQDQFIDDDEEETCPLCVEEFDLADQGFRPCPCGYQICQFCYHNVKTNMNGLCPACRRPYRDEDIHYKLITPEETAAHKARQAQKQKKTQAALQKEKQKAEADNLSRKHLAGMRVVQKNLVYVTGLSPNSQEDQLLQTLRGDQYFGQYGKIIKIVVSKAKDPSHPHSVGVYVTYERKEDAASCIAAVDGSKNGDRTLRAQFGTTKYCSAYLRGETCTNRNCMFLHEPGEANESYSRADLSALNAGSSQQGSGRPPPPQSQQPVASAAQPMMRQLSEDTPQSPALERPALPSTASWATRPSTLGRDESRLMSTPHGSPAPARSTPALAQVEPAQEFEAPSTAPPETKSAETAATTPPPPKRLLVSPLTALIRGFKIEDFTFVWSPVSLSQTDRDIIENYPPLFDPSGGARRRVRRQREEEQRRMEQEAQAFQQPPAIEPEDNPEMSGSLQLGGEPEERATGSQQGAIHPPGQDGGLDQRFQFGGAASSPSASERGLTTQQHQQMLLQTLKPTVQGTYVNGGNQSSAFQSSFPQQTNAPPGHQRNTSRYSFANDTASASASVKPVANPKLMNQQSAMMPQAGGYHFGAQHQQPHGQFYTSNVQGPPPGLKTTGTPPVSGNLTFGQGHGFATGGLQYGAGGTRNVQDTYMRDMMRANGRDASNGSVDAKHETDFPPLASSSRQHASVSGISLEGSRRSTPSMPPGLETSRRSTPTVPPGLSAVPKLTALPDLEGSASRPGSRPSSRASVQRNLSQILPAVPLTPTKGTPSRQGSRDDFDKIIPAETPSKPSRSTTSSDLKIATSADEQEKVVSDRRDQSDDLAVKPAAPVVADVRKVSASPTQGAGLQRVGDASPAKGQNHAPASGTKAEALNASKIDTSKPEPTKKHSLIKLDINAAADKKEKIATPTTATPSEAGSYAKPQRTASLASSPAKLPESPASAIASPAARPAPRTLRLTSTQTVPKADVPPAQPSFTPTLPNVAAHRLPSRRPSVSSMHLPGTPSSEHNPMSDNLSIASTSLSRANSPPPGVSRVGSAPVRDKTKSQQKKDRQKIAKEKEEQDLKAKVEQAGKALAQETEQEAVVSRMKKTKKEKAAKPKTKSVVPTADSTPTASRPASPGPKVVPEVAVKPESPPVAETVVATPTKAPAVQPILQSPNGPSPPATPTLSPAQLIAELKQSAPEIQKCIDSLFRISTSHNQKQQPNVSLKDLASSNMWKPDFKVNLKKEDVEALLKGKVPAIHYGGEDTRVFDRGMVTPSGAHLRALTKELESRFLELEQALREMPEELRFHPSKPQNDTKFPTIDLEDMRRQFENANGRGVSVMEQMVQDGSTMKKGAFLVDEARKYINEFVMPPVTPPPHVGNATRVQQVAHALQGANSEAGVPSVEIAERQLSESKRMMDEKENALKKAIKKNKRVAGLT